jgi:hypothetical protein
VITFTQGKFTRANHVSVTAPHHMTVAEVLAFADKLRDAHVPLDMKVSYSTNYHDGHFNGLSVHWTEEKEPCEFS